MKDFIDIGSGDLERKDNTGTPDPVDPANDTVAAKEAIEEFMRTFTAFSEKTDKRFLKLESEKKADPVDLETVTRMQDSMDKLTDQVKSIRLENSRPSLTLPDGQKRDLSDVEVKHAAAVNAYIRNGDEAGLRTDELKSLSVGSDPDGGYTVHAAMDSAIDRVLSEVSPIRSLATVQQISTSSVKRLVNTGGTSSGWVGEEGGRPQTDGSKLRERQFPVMELYAMPAATQSLLDDSAVNIENWIAGEVNIEFAEQEGRAFIMGSGVDRPRGIVGGYDPIADANFTEAGARPGFIATGVNGGFAAGPGGDVDNLLDLVYSLKSAYRANSRFIMNRLAQRDIRKMEDGDGRKVWQPGLAEGQPASLLGYGITEAEDMPDIAADSYSIAFGDFRRAYLIVDRIGVRIIRDPFTNKPYILFYTTKRVGGGVKFFEAYKLLKFAA